MKGWFRRALVIALLLLAIGSASLAGRFWYLRSSGGIQVIRGVAYFGRTDEDGGFWTNPSKKVTGILSAFFAIEEKVRQLSDSPRVDNIRVDYEGDVAESFVRQKVLEEFEIQLPQELTFIESGWIGAPDDEETLTCCWKVPPGVAEKLLKQLEECFQQGKKIGDLENGGWGGVLYPSEAVLNMRILETPIKLQGCWFASGTVVLTEYRPTSDLNHSEIFFDKERLILGYRYSFYH